MTAPIASTYQFSLVHQKNRCVCFQVDSFGLLDDLQTAHRNIGLIGKAETHEMQHAVQNLKIKAIEDKTRLGQIIWCPAAKPSTANQVPGESVYPAIAI